MKDPKNCGKDCEGKKPWPMIFPATYEFDDNHDDNGPIGGTSTCTMKTPATGTETAKEEVIECDCASPKEFKFRNKGMVF